MERRRGSKEISGGEKRQGATERKERKREKREKKEERKAPWATSRSCDDPHAAIIPHTHLYKEHGRQDAAVCDRGFTFVIV